MPKISVLMSVYNEPVDWMRQAIESILNQTYKDFEFIIVSDNPSYIEGNALLKQYARNDERIVIILNDENIGLTRSLNKGLAVANGEYIARMDADDVSMKNRLEKQYSYLQRNSNVFICGGAADIINENDNVVGEIPVLTTDKEIKSLMLLQSPFIHPSVMWRNSKEVFYDERFRYAQDYKLWVDLSDLKFGNISDKILKYRITKQQITSSHRDEQVEFSKIIMAESLKKILLIDDDDWIKQFFSLIYKKEVVYHEKLEQIIPSFLKLVTEKQLDSAVLRKIVFLNLALCLCEYNRKPFFTILLSYTNVGLNNYFVLLYYVIKVSLHNMRKKDL